MAKNYTFPRMNVNIWDKSVTFPFVPEETPLHKPLIIGFSEKGKPNVPMYVNVDELKDQFGPGTIDEYSKWFHHPNIFLKETLKYQKAFFVRVIDENATTANVVLVLETYESNGTYYLKWITKTIDEIKTIVGDETLTYDTLPTYPISESIDGVSVNGTGYPIIAIDAGSPGKAGNNTGFVFFYDVDTDTDKQQRVESILYSMGYFEKPYGYDTPLPIRNIFDDKYFEFSFKKDAVDSQTTKRYYFDDVMKDEFRDKIFNTHIYADNIKTIGEAILTVETSNELAGGDVPFLVNLISGKYLDNTAYSNVQFLEDSKILDQDIYIYMLGGDDGDTSVDKLESLTQAWLSGTVYPDIKDQARYPITHLYDSGYSMSAKQALIDFVGVRKDVKIIISTQVSSIVPNSKEEDQSAGSTLRGQALLHPESPIYGTSACRITIFQQAGILPDSPWEKWVPATFAILRKRSQFHNAKYIKGTFKGLPNSEVDCFQKVNWTPSDNDHKQLSWDTGLNYFQYYDMVSIHYPDIKSVYMYDTSLLSSDEFTDYVIYHMHICQEVWSKFVGIEEPLPTLISKIKNTLDDKAQKTFGSYVSIINNPYQTELDKQLGYSLTVECRFIGNMPNRQWNVIFMIERPSGK